MRKAFRDVHQVVLTRSYRSSQPVLDAAHELISLDKKREHSKTLVADESYLQSRMIENIVPKFMALRSHSEEINWVSCTVKYLVEQGVPIHEIAVLTRTGIFASEIAPSVQRISGIKTIVLGGTSLVDTDEANLFYTILRLIQYPDRDLFVLNLIRRFYLFITPKDLGAAMAKAKSLNVPLVTVLRESSSWITPAKKEKLDQFLEMIDMSRNILADNPKGLDNVVEALRFCLKKLEFHKKIMAKYPSTYLNRLQNASDFIGYLYSIQDYVQWELEGFANRTFLEQLLASSALYHVTPTSDELVISTVHAAKGREWRVVLIVNANDKSFPHIRSHGSLKDVGEERRVLYVAMSRAKERLFVSYHEEGLRMVGEKNVPSRFFTKQVLSKFDISGEDSTKTAGLWSNCKFNRILLFALITDSFSPYYRCSC